MLADESYLYSITELDQRIYQRVIRRDHPLRRVLERIPWEAFRETLESYYCRDRGQPAIDPVRMLKLEYLRYHFNLSDRQVIDRCETDVSFRFFMQVGLRYHFPDPSLLTRFRGRLGEKGFHEIFQKLISIAREEGVVKDRLRLKDASHVLANIAVPTTLKLVAHARDRLLEAARPWDSEAAEGQQINIELLRERTTGQPDSEVLEVRVTLLQEILTWAETIPAPPDAATNKSWQRLLAACQLAHKILFDQSHPEAGRRTLSVSDPDARRGKHGEWYEGYMLDVLMDADSELITELNTLEAGGDEAKDAPELVRREEQAHGNDIESLSIDGAGFNGEMLLALEDPEKGLGVTTYVPPKKESVSDKFGPADFTTSEERTYVTCPAGQQSRYRQRDRRGHGFIYRFARQQCDGCPLAQQCVSRPEHGAFGKSVQKSDYEKEYRRARERAQTEAYALVRRQHPAIERKLNEVMNHHGGRRARYRGWAKVHLQQCMTCFTVNVKRLVQLLGSHSAPATNRLATT